jgi:hypothetical protein
VRDQCEVYWWSWRDWDDIRSLPERAGSLPLQPRQSLRGHGEMATVQRTRKC